MAQQESTTVASLVERLQQISKPYQEPEYVETVTVTLGSISLR